MNLEGLTLHILTNKLKEELLGGKIYKVFMPSYESLLCLLYTSPSPRDTR